LLILAGWVFTANPVHAGEGRKLLDSYLANLSTLEAKFQQTLVDENGIVLEESNGRVYLQRPGKFRWDYEAPYEQTIVADGAKVWIYDKDLEQVTVKPLMAAIGNTPALLLGGDVDIDAEFKITDQGETQGLTWLVLAPKETEDKQFSDIRLGFEGAALRRMELVDSFTQTTRIQFIDEERNAGIDASLFVFEPPAGVDVLNETEGL
jgi:outer membrane lipoprotein carrier protein